MTNSIITTLNWSHVGFQHNNMRAFVTFGASPESVTNGSFNYYATVIQDENQEIFSQEFDSLSSACRYINDKYSDWEFVDLTNKNGKEGSCSTCVAH